MSTSVPSGSGLGSAPSGAGPSTTKTDVNKDVWAKHLRGLSSPEQFMVSIQSKKGIASYLSNERAYYTAARPMILQLLDTARDTLRTVNGLGPDAEFTCDAVADEWKRHAGAYRQVVAVVSNMRQKFRDPEHQARLLSHVASALKVDERAKWEAERTAENQWTPTLSLIFKRICSTLPNTPSGPRPTSIGGTGSSNSRPTQTQSRLNFKRSALSSSDLVTGPGPGPDPDSDIEEVEPPPGYQPPVQSRSKIQATSKPDPPSSSKLLSTSKPPSSSKHPTATKPLSASKRRPRIKPISSRSHGSASGSGTLGVGGPAVIDLSLTSPSSDSDVNQGSSNAKPGDGAQQGHASTKQKYLQEGGSKVDVDVNDEAKESEPPSLPMSTTTQLLRPVASSHSTLPEEMLDSVDISVDNSNMDPEPDIAAAAAAPDEAMDKLSTRMREVSVTPSVSGTGAGMSPMQNFPPREESQRTSSTVGARSESPISPDTTGLPTQLERGRKREQEHEANQSPITPTQRNLTLEPPMMSRIRNLSIEPSMDLDFEHAQPLLSGSSLSTMMDTNTSAGLPPESTLGPSLPPSIPASLSKSIVGPHLSITPEPTGALPSTLPGTTTKTISPVRRTLNSMPPPVVPSVSLAAISQPSAPLLPPAQTQTSVDALPSVFASTQPNASHPQPSASAPLPEEFEPNINISSPQRGRSVPPWTPLARLPSPASPSAPSLVVPQLYAPQAPSVHPTPFAPLAPLASTSLAPSPAPARIRPLSHVAGPVWPSYPPQPSPLSRPSPPAPPPTLPMEQPTAQPQMKSAAETQARPSSVLSPISSQRPVLRIQTDPPESVLLTTTSGLRQHISAPSEASYSTAAPVPAPAASSSSRTPVHQMRNYLPSSPSARLVVSPSNTASAAPPALISSASFAQVSASIRASSGMPAIGTESISVPLTIKKKKKKKPMLDDFISADLEEFNKRKATVPTAPTASTAPASTSGSALTAAIPNPATLELGPLKTESVPSSNAAVSGSHNVKDVEMNSSTTPIGRGHVLSRTSTIYTPSPMKPSSSTSASVMIAQKALQHTTTSTPAAQSPMASSPGLPTQNVVPHDNPNTSVTTPALAAYLAQQEAALRARHDLDCAELSLAGLSHRTAEQPPYTTVCLISLALWESPEKTLPSAKIVEKIANRFPWYSQPEQKAKFKGAVQSYLSNMAMFNKVKLGQGSGFAWTLDFAHIRKKGAPKPAGMRGSPVTPEISDPPFEHTMTMTTPVLSPQKAVPHSVRHAQDAPQTNVGGPASNTVSRETVQESAHIVPELSSIVAPSNYVVMGQGDESVEQASVSPSRSGPSIQPTTLPSQSPGPSPTTQAAEDELEEGEVADWIETRSIASSRGATPRPNAYVAGHKRRPSGSPDNVPDTKRTRVGAGGMDADNQPRVSIGATTSAPAPSSSPISGFGNAPGAPESSGAGIVDRAAQPESDDFEIPGLSAKVDVPRSPSSPANETNDSTFRNYFQLDDAMPLSLTALPDPARYYRPAQSTTLLVALAIYSSPEKQMTVTQIYQALQDRFEWYSTSEHEKTMKNTVLNLLSKHEIFMLVGKRGGDTPGEGWIVALPSQPSRPYPHMNSTHTKEDTLEPLELSLAPKPVAQSAEDDAAADVVMDTSPEDDQVFMDIFGDHKASQYSIIDVKSGLPHQGSIHISVSLLPTVVDAIRRWVDRPEPERRPDDCLSVSLSVYKDLETQQLLQHRSTWPSVVWPKKGELNLRIQSSTDNSVQAFPLAPPNETMGDNRLDLSAALRSGLSQLSIDQAEPMSNYTFVISSHPPVTRLPWKYSQALDEPFANVSVVHCDDLLSRFRAIS